jgi:hypothetical protein
MLLNKVEKTNGKSVMFQLQTAQTSLQFPEKRYQTKRISFIPFGETYQPITTSENTLLQWL